MKHFICLLLIILANCLLLSCAVDRSKFRTCQDTRFCRTYRQFQPSTNSNEWFRLSKDTVSEGIGRVTGQILSSPNANPLNLEISFLQTGNLRLKINEKASRWQPTDLLIPNGLKTTTYLKTPASSLPAAWKNKDANSFVSYTFKATVEDSKDPLASVAAAPLESVVVMQFAPFKLELYHDQILVISINDRNLIHFEQRSNDEQRKLAAGSHNAVEINLEDRHQGKEIIDYGEDGLAIYADGTREEKAAVVETAHHAESHIESFNGHTDTVPHGPTSVGIDIAFPFTEHVYGIPEHTTPLSLPVTTQSSAPAGRSKKYEEPYRLYTLDVFEYELDETMALYGNVPFLWGHGLVNNGERAVSSGIFWFNPSETFVDISDGTTAREKGKVHKESHWISESGEIDVFLMAGPTPQALFSQYASITGAQALPPIFALGYHQCRWNYRDERDVMQVNGQFEALDYPYDVLWLDIEHTNGKRYFTWDSQLFPNPISMQETLSAQGRKMVTIVDPHIKRDDGYHIHSEATSKSLYIKDKSGSKDFDGWCWPGSSSYLDFTNQHVRNWWARQFSLDKYTGSTLELYTWNDMNEPSVFNGPEVSMPKDARNLDGVEHREWHNLYGIYMQMATAQGLVERSKEKKLRPFVLTRSIWAGSQRHGAMWTGDNKASWDHLKISAPMLLSLNLAGISFSGADVGGFFGDSTAELWTRWYQAGAFTPFFRGHAHHDTKRKEPWVYGEPHTSIHRKTAMLRYSLLPYWYTTFLQAYETGMPVMRALFLEFPRNAATFTIDDSWLVGSSILVHPVTDAGARSVSVYLPSEDKSVIGAPGCGNAPWYELESLKPVTPGANGRLEYPVELSTIPAFIRPGSIIPRKLRLRRSATLMHYDPYTLVVTPGPCNTAEGYLYMDDEKTASFEEQGHFIYKKFTFSGTVLSSKDYKRAIASPNKGGKFIHQNPTFAAEGVVNTIERVVLAGQTKAPKKVVLSTGAEGSQKTTELGFVFDGTAKTLTIKKPNSRACEDWSISLEF